MSYYLVVFVCVSELHRKRERETVAREFHRKRATVAPV